MRLQKPSPNDFAMTTGGAPLVRAAAATTANGEGDKDLARIMHHMPRFCMPGPHAYCTRTPSIRPVWIGVRQLAVQRVWV
jgi:hypothetical protein